MAPLQAFLLRTALPDGLVKRDTPIPAPSHSPSPLLNSVPGSHLSSILSLVGLARSEGILCISLFIVSKCATSFPTLLAFVMPQALQICSK